jgi:hypothetical protein
MIRDLGPEAVKGMINDSPEKRLGNADEVAHMVSSPARRPAASAYG